MPRRLTTPPGLPGLAELRVALASLQADTPRRWGTMAPADMAEHCARFVDLYSGRLPVSPLVVGFARCFGRPLLRRLLATPPERAAKGMTTAPGLRVTDHPALDSARMRLDQALSEAMAWKGTIRHPMYGKMEAEEMQMLVAHYTAHHFRQFGLIP